MTSLIQNLAATLPAAYSPYYAISLGADVSVFEFTITWFGSFIVEGNGFPFFISGTFGLLALVFSLVFVRETPRKNETSAP